MTTKGHTMIDQATTANELRELIAQASTRLAQLEQAATVTEEQLRADLGAVVTDLDKLIGPDNPTVKSAATLTQANLYTPSELAAASGIAHDAELAWMLTIARTVRDLARVVSGTLA